jgi:rare lipoprotein A (peptidoglycan hydrolase)
MTTSRARVTAGATALGAVLAVVPATATSTTPAAQAAQSATVAAVVPATERVRKRTPRLTVRHVRRNVMAGSSASVTGRLLPGLKGHVVRLQAQRSGHWTTVDRAVTRSHGAYRLKLDAGTPGTVKLRVVFPGDKTATETRRSAGHVNVFRRAVASWYALYGSPLACGGTLGYSELGVAHKTLPCGTKLTLRYRGRSVRVRVIDRGPYVGGRDFDLTGATKRALRFVDGVGTVLATR